MKLWRIALGVFLLCCAALLLIPLLRFEQQNFLLGIVALASGILLLTDK